ncbi:MAG: hypothetical protein Q7S53_00965 [bacterium]|nr:hypothetical protein [bacterium]
MSKKIIKLTFVFLVICIFVSMAAVAVRAENTEAPDATNTTELSGESQKKQAEKQREQLKKEQEKAKEEKVKLKEKQKKLAEAKREAAKKIDEVIKKLQKIKERVSNMPTISSDLKTQLNSKIDDWVTKLNTRKAAVNASTTKEELKVAMDGFRADVKEAKRVIKDIVESIHETHLQKVIAKIEAFIPKVEAKVAAITDNAKKTEATDLVNDAKVQITNAKTLNDAGKIEEARKAIKTAYRDLKNALEIANEKEASDE